MNRTRKAFLNENCYKLTGSAGFLIRFFPTEKEVMSGMGRSGTLHAWQQEGVVPDIQTIGKGLGGGYAPVAAFMINHRVADTLESGTGYKSTISFFFLIFFSFRRRFGLF